MTPAQGPLPAPFQIHSVHFNFPGGQAIHLRDPGTNQLIGVSAEWVSGARSEPAAFVRGTTPQVQAVFRAGAAGGGNFVVGADGSPCQVAETPITLAFDPATGLSQPVTFTFANAFPNQIGVHDAKIDWYVRDQDDRSTCHPIGISTHRLCTTWRPMALNAGQGLMDWVYLPLMEWTCRWAAGAADERQICDAIIQNLHSSGLQYGIDYREVRDMLLHGGGMCSGWYKMFQQLAHCQGVFVHRRCFLVEWRTVPSSEIHWCALVIRPGGLNQRHPTHPDAQFRDHDTPFPGTGADVLTIRAERRYRFWGDPTPGYWGDGHCVNFLEFGGRLFLYDPSFGTGPFEMDPPLPPDNTTVLGGPQLASFKAAYLDGAVDYMMGSLYNGGAVLRGRRGLRRERDHGEDGPDSAGRQREPRDHVRLGWVREVRIMEPAVEQLAGAVTGDPALRPVRRWQDLLRAMREVIARPLDWRAEQALLAVIRFEGDLNLAEGSAPPHSMSPEEMLKSLAVQALAKWTGLTHLLEMQRVEATTTSSVLASIVRAAIQKESQRAHPASELEVVALLRPTPRREVTAGLLDRSFGRKPSKALLTARPRSAAIWQTALGPYTEYHIPLPLYRMDLVKQPVYFEHGLTVFEGSGLRTRPPEEEAVLRRVARRKRARA